MNNDIYSFDFTRTLPPPLKNDPKMLALARGIADELQSIVRETKKNIIYARIDELDEATLDVLAYDLHVDWYDFTYPLEVKRATIKDSMKVHRKLGTKYAVETALGNVFPGTRVEEWFEYGGDPYMFKVVIGATSAGVSEDRQAAVLERVRFYKNLRSHLEAISYKIEKHAKVSVGAYHAIAHRLSIYPYLAGDLASSGTAAWAGYAQITTRLEIYPNPDFSDPLLWPDFE